MRGILGFAPWSFMGGKNPHPQSLKIMLLITFSDSNHTAPNFLFFSFDPPEGLPIINQFFEEFLMVFFFFPLRVVRICV